MEPKEELIIPIYKEADGIHLENDGEDCHHYSGNQVFHFSEILAISSKGLYEKKHYSRGGALIFVKNREEPYLTRDDYSVKKIYQELNKNPLACMSGLNQYGSCNLYAKYESAKIIKDKDKNTHYVILENGAKLILTKEAYRKIQWLKRWREKGVMKTCFFETKKDKADTSVLSLFTAVFLLGIAVFLVELIDTSLSSGSLLCACVE